MILYDFPIAQTFYGGLYACYVCAHILLFFSLLVSYQSIQMEGAQWLSGRVLDSRPKGRGFEPHRRHCVVSWALSKNINPSLVLVQPKKTRPYITERLLVGRKESNQTQLFKWFAKKGLRDIFRIHKSSQTAR